MTEQGPANTVVAVAYGHSLAHRRRDGADMSCSCAKLCSARVSTGGLLSVGSGFIASVCVVAFLRRLALLILLSMPANPSAAASQPRLFPDAAVKRLQATCFLRTVFVVQDAMALGLWGQPLGGEPSVSARKTEIMHSHGTFHNTRRWEAKNWPSCLIPDPIYLSLLPDRCARVRAHRQVYTFAFSSPTARDCCIFFIAVYAVVTSTAANLSWCWRRRDGGRRRTLDEIG
jgi:hypothetical protein